MTPRTRADRALLRLLGRRGGLLTVGEAATRTGCPLTEVESALLRLAVAGGADLRVGSDGTVAYRFGPHLRRRLLASSWRLRLEAIAAWLWQRIFGLVRISFGLVLVVLVAVFTLVVLVVAAVQILRSDDGAEVLLHLLWAGLELLVRVLVLLLSDGLGGSWQDGSRLRLPSSSLLPSATTGKQGGEKRLAFFEAVYSLLFGDGDPNSSLEQRRWRRIGSFLQHRGGAVIAEDIAPLLDLPARPRDGLQAMEMAEQAMLAVLLRFDGRPEVSEAGDLAFRFPSLQVRSTDPRRPARLATAKAARPAATLPMVDGIAAPVSLPPYGPAPAPGPPHGTPREGTSRRAARDERPAPALRERTIPFSRTTLRQRRLYAGLCGSLLVLSPLMLALNLPQSPPPALVHLALFAMTYALLLALVPLLRLTVVRARNRRIADRNAHRRSWTRIGPRQRLLLERRRRFARSFARQLTLEESGLAYTTEHDLLEQRIEHLPDP